MKNYFKRMNSWLLEQNVKILGINWWFKKYLYPSSPAAKKERKKKKKYLSKHII